MHYGYSIYTIPAYFDIILPFLSKPRIIIWLIKSTLTRSERVFEL